MDAYNNYYPKKWGVRYNTEKDINEMLYKIGIAFIIGVFLGVIVLCLLYLRARRANEQQLRLREQTIRAQENAVDELESWIGSVHIGTANPPREGPVPNPFQLFSPRVEIHPENEPDELGDGPDRDRAQQARRRPV